MKKSLLFILMLLGLGFQANSQTTAYCHTFNSGTGVSEYDPNNTITYSVTANELTIVLTNAVVWGNNEVKIEFPSLLDLSAASATNIVSFDAKVSGALAVTGGGCNAGTNYVPLGISFYDNADNYTSGFATANGIFDANYSNFTATIGNWSTAGNSTVKGISIKPADPGQNCSGTSVVNGTIIIKNLKINNGTCAPVSIPTSYCGDFSTVSGLSEYDPNNTIAYSVASNELTVDFDDAVLYGNNEVKLDFPVALDLSAASTTDLVSFDVLVASALAVTGGGCDANINYVPLSFTFYDNSGDTYATGFATNDGIFDETGYVRFTVDGILSGTGFDNTAVKGIALKPGDPGQNCTSGTSVVNGQFKLKNLGINSSTCGSPTSVHRKDEFLRSIVYPNPSSESITLDFALKNSSQVKVVLTDALGKTVMTLAEGSFSELNKQISVASLHKGVYTLTYYINDEVSKSELLMVK